MHRLVIALLAAIDAAVAVVASVAFIAAPLTLFWAFQLGSGWDQLWATSARIWQLGAFTPLHIGIDTDAAAALGIPEAAASFTLSLAPLGFAAFAALFAARSGARAVRAGSWPIGAASGAVVYALLTAIIALSAQGGFASVTLWQALLLPTLVYLVPMLVGAFVAAWRDGDRGLIDRLHDIADGFSEAWSELPSLLGRGLAMLLTGFIGLGALGVLLSIMTRAGDMVTLFQSTGVDGWGALLLTLAHFAYLPTLIVWAFSWIAGPGFQVGAGSSIAPSGSDTGVVPGLPLFGLLPEGGSTWTTLVVLLPLALAAFVGWHLRSRYAAVFGDSERMAPRIVLTAALAAVSAGVAALAGLLASGSIGPGRMAAFGPHIGGLALAVGIEVAIGAGILLIAPRSIAERAKSVLSGDEDDAVEVYADR